MSNERVIFDNYHDKMSDYDDIRELLLEEHDAEEITDDMIYDEMAFRDGLAWQELHNDLRRFFDGENWLAMGKVGRWDGDYAVGCAFDKFDDFFYKATQDCDYWKIWENNGHFYLECSHHDGTNTFEIKRITQRARNYIEDWTSDKSDAEKHAVVFRCNLFSSLPWFTRKMWGVNNVKV